MILHDDFLKAGLLDEDPLEEGLSIADINFIREVLCPTETEWVTKYRQRIPVVDMEDAHIINTILMLERSNATAVATYPTLLVEARKRKLSLDKPIIRDMSAE